MKKIPSLFKRAYHGDYLVMDEVVEGSEWVLDGEGTPTEKIDGTACMTKDGVLYRRFDRKKNKKTQEYKPAPPGWVPCEEKPNEHTGHWPGWAPVGEGTGDKWHREAIENYPNRLHSNQTWELVGPKIQGNPYGLRSHALWPHGKIGLPEIPRTFGDTRLYLLRNNLEGIVWHHPDGRMVKIKARDFGLPWPPDRGGQ